jgi:hypothetical protein
VALTLANLNADPVSYIITAFEEDSIIELKDGITSTIQRVYLDSRMHFYYTVRSNKEALVSLSCTSGDVAIESALYSPNTSLSKDHWPWPPLPKVGQEARSSTSVKFTSKMIDSQCDLTECYLLVSLGLKGEQDEEEEVDIEAVSGYDIVQIQVVTDTLMLKDAEKVLLDLSDNETRLATYELGPVLAQNASL